MPQSKTETSDKLTAKILNIFFYAFIAALVVIFLKFISFAVSGPIIRNYLSSKVEKETNGLYQLKIKTLNVEILTGNVTIRNIILDPDQEKINSLKEKHPDSVVSTINLKIKCIDITGLSWFKYLLSGKVYADGFLCDKVLLSINRRNKENQNDTLSFIGKLPEFSDVFAEVIQIDTIRLSNWRIKYKDETESKPAIYQVDNLFIASKNFILSKERISNPLFSDEIKIVAENFYMNSPENNISMAIDKLETTGNESLQASYLTFSKKPENTKYRKAEIDFIANKVSCNKINLASLLNEKKTEIQKIKVEDVNMHVYTNKNLPKEQVPKKFPAELVSGRTNTLKIDSIEFSHCYITYDERQKDDGGILEVSFHNTDLLIVDLTNDPEIATNTPARVLGTTNLYGKSLLTLRMQINLSEEKSFTYKGEIASIDAPAFNAITIPSDGLKFNDGQIQNLKYNINVKNGVAKGNIEMSFKGVNVSIVNSQNEKSKLKSDLANLVINSEGEESSEISYNYKPYTGFFKFLVQPVVIGVSDIVVKDIIPGEDLAKK
ncbi:MAG: hypothetical protein ACK40G_03225 [Cytophagaceae bacterium]